MTNKELLAYLAGIIDGEGYIGIKRDVIKGRGKSPVYYERMSVANTNKELIELFVRTFNCGKVYAHKASKLSRRGYQSWEVSNRIAVSVLRKVYPYLRVKRPEAALVLKLARNKVRKYFILPKHIIDYRQKLYLSVKALHTFT